MARTSARLAAGLATVALLWSGGLIAGASAAAADEQSGEDGQAEVDTGLVEIPYLEPVEITPAAGWSIDCSSVGELEGVEAVCADGKVTLRADTYDSAWGEHVLNVSMSAGSASADVAYRVRQGAPAAPVLAASIIDAPLEIGRQSLIPFALLGIECTLCVEHPAVSVTATTPGLIAGVSGAHLSLRASTPGEATVTLEVTDDAGQASSSEISVYVTPAASGQWPVALHVIRPSWDGLSLADIAWGNDLRFSCPPDPVVSLTCAADGTVAVANSPTSLAQGDEIPMPVQFSFRVVDNDGRQAIGSVTVDPDADAAADGMLAPVTWAETADLGIAVAAPPDEDEGGEEASVLSELDRILQEVPTP